MFQYVAGLTSVMMSVASVPSEMSDSLHHQTSPRSRSDFSADSAVADTYVYGYNMH